MTVYAVSVLLLFGHKAAREFGIVGLWQLVFSDVQAIAQVLTQKRAVVCIDTPAIWPNHCADWASTHWHPYCLTRISRIADEVCVLAACHDRTAQPLLGAATCGNGR